MPDLRASQASTATTVIDMQISCLKSAIWYFYGGWKKRCSDQISCIKREDEGKNKDLSLHLFCPKRPRLCLSFHKLRKTSNIGQTKHEHSNPFRVLKSSQNKTVFPLDKGKHRTAAKLIYASHSCQELAQEICWRQNARSQICVLSSQCCKKMIKLKAARQLRTLSWLNSSSLPPPYVKRCEIAETAAWPGPFCETPARFF